MLKLLKLQRLTLLFSLTLLSGCSAGIDDYAETQPTLLLEEYFSGHLAAYGIVQDRSGKVIRRFRVQMQGSWKSELSENGQEQLKGTLVEDFYYDDGEQQQRIWYLTKLENGHYTGQASDVSQMAQGQTRGFALNWSYTLAIEVDEETWEIAFDDWMYQLDNKRLINRATMSKWGFKVGEVTLWMEKLDESL